MSTMQHTPQPAVRHRIWLVAATLGAAAVLTLVLIAINSDPSAPTGKAISAPSNQGASWLDNVTAARSAIAHGEPAPVAPDVAAQRDTLAAASSAVTSRAAVQKPQPESEALIDARFRHPVPAGQR